MTGLFTVRNDPSTRVRPAPIGFSIGHPSITAGSLGARVVDASGNHYILSNNHVIANNNAASIGDPILQPGPADGGQNPEDRIGTLAAFQSITFSSSANNLMDAAIASVDPVDVSNATPPGSGYGTPSSRIYGDATGDGYFDDVAALLGLPVQKYGRTTGLSQGQVTGVNATISICYATFFIWCTRSARFVDQILISPGNFSDGGDSGSLIVTDDEHRNPVGLLFAGSATQTVANRIDHVLHRFNVTIDGDGDSPPPPPPPADAPALHTFSDDFAGPHVDTEHWEIFGPPGRIVQDNRLTITLAPNTAEQAYMRSTGDYNLTGSSTFMEVSSVAGGNNATETTLLVGTADLVQYVAIANYAGRFSAWYQWEEDDFHEVGSTTLNLQQHRFQRIREDGGNVLFETSSNGTSWTTRYTVQHQFDQIEWLRVFVGVTSWEPTASNPTPAHIEGLNTTVPASPRALTATATSDNRIDLAWQDRSVNEAGFRIERRLAGTGNFQEIAAVGASMTSFADTGLAASTSFEYQVRAFNATGASSPAGPVTATTQDLPPFMDLAISAVQAPATANQGDVVQVAVTLANVGEGNVNTAVAVTLRDAANNIIGTQTVTGLAAGGSAVRTFSWNTASAPIGPNTLTARHDFADDNPDNDQATTTVAIEEPPPPSATMHIGDLDNVSTRSLFSWTPRVSVLVHDGAHNLVPNATVTAEWRSGNSVEATGSCTTGSTGRCIISRGSVIIWSTQRIFTVTGVSHATLVYEPIDNHDPDGDSNGTTIVVQRP